MWERHSRSAPLTGIQENAVPLPSDILDCQVSRVRTVSRFSLRCLATDLDLSLTRNSSTCRIVLPSPPCSMPVSPCATDLPPLLSIEIILWHRRCSAIPAAVHCVPQG